MTNSPGDALPRSDIFQKLDWQSCRGCTVEPYIKYEKEQVLEGAVIWNRFFFRQDNQENFKEILWSEKLRSGYEITWPFLSISLRLLMPLLPLGWPCCFLRG
jgi:hypothetical protein